MSLPSGVTAATLTVRATKTTLTSPTTISVSIAPSVDLKHAVSGVKLSAMIETLVSGRGLASQVLVPHSGQAGFVDEAGTAVADWYYVATLTYTTTGGAQAAAPRSRAFRLATGTAVELETLPTHRPAPPEDPDVPETNLPPRLSSAGLSAAFAPATSGAMATAATLSKIKRGWEDATVLLLGDSTANSSGEWFYLLQQKLAADWPTHTFKHYFWNDTSNTYDAPVTIATGSGSRTVHFYNASVSGTKADYLLGSKFASAIRAVSPDLIFTSYGHNDGSTDVTGARNSARSRILSLSETLALTHPMASIIILTQNRRADVSDETWGVRASRYEKAAEQAGRGFIDIHRVFADKANFADYILSDGVHPATATDAGKLNGSDLWASAVHQQMKYNPAISPRPATPSSFATPAANLLTNGDFASFASPPTLPSWTATNATLSKDVTNFEAPHAYAVRIQSATPGSTSIYQDLPIAQFKGRWITVAARIWVPEGQVPTAARVGIEDGVSNLTSIANLSARSGFVWVVQSKQVDPAATFARVRVYAGSAASTSYDITVDRVIVAPGVLPRDMR